MSTSRKLLLLIPAAILMVVMVIPRGSIGSIGMLMCLILLGISLLYQHFLTNREDEDRQTE